MSEFTRACPATREYDNDLLQREIAEVEDAITASIIHPWASVSGNVERSRPLVKLSAIELRGHPSETSSPALYYDALRMSEEALRRVIVRGMGYNATELLVEQTIENSRGPNLVKGDAHTFESEVGRGRIHQGIRGEFVAGADKVLRALALASFDLFQQEKQDDILCTFEDTSKRVRAYGERALDHKFGDAWRQLDPADIASMKVKEIDGQKLSRYDRHSLLKPNKPTDARASLANATATAAEFTAIGIQDMQRALARAGCPRDQRYAYAFGNIDKLAFAASLPFWPAQELGMRANDLDVDPVFSALRCEATGLYSITFKNDAYRNYYEKGSVGVCQGIQPLKVGFMQSHDLRRIGQFNRMIEGLAVVDGKQIVSEQAKSLGWITSAYAATACVLSLAHKGGYDFCEGE